MKLKKIAALGLASVMTLSLAACGGGDSGNGGGGSSEPAEVNQDPSSFTAKELTVNIWDNNQLAGLQKIADKWTETSGVKVNINVVEWDSYWTLLESGASGGTLPDVFWMHSNMAQMYMENDMLLNLDPYIEADSAIDLANYYEGVTNLYTRSDGKHYALPKDHDTIALLYNKALFDKYGVAYPDNTWTWEDVQKAAAKITEGGKADGIYGYAVDTSNNQDGWYNVVQCYGGKIINDDHTGTTIGSAEGKAGMEMVRQILTVAAPQVTVSETKTDSLFLSGKVAMITQGSWMINNYYTAENAKDYAWAIMPYADVNGNGTCEKEERCSAYNGLGWAADAKTEDPNAAYSLISYFCSEEGQKMQAELGVTMAGMKSVSDEFVNEFEGMDISPFLQIEEEGTLFFRPYTRQTSKWEDPLQKAGCFLDAWQNPDDAAAMSTACDNAQKIIDDAIAAEKK